MNDILTQVRQELAAENVSPEDAAMMEADAIQNFDSYYLQEHHQDLERMLQNEQNAHMLLQAQTVPVEVLDSDDEEFRRVP